jgi:diadenosine tetraphosphatase ApaH/serine/threonine PP2A family protein phosphatase
MKRHPALTAEQIAFLHGLPPTVQINEMLFCHATPRNDVDIFTERTPEERIADLFADVDVVVCGHTHTQFERMIAGKRVLNSGSVGMPYEDAPGAYWTLDLVHRHTEYGGAEPVGAGNSNRRRWRASCPASATVTPAAVMAEVCREHAWFGVVRSTSSTTASISFSPSSRARSLWSAPAIATTRVSPAATAATARLCSGGTIESRQPYTTVVGTFTRARWSASG